MTRQVIFLIPLVLILPLFFGLDGILFAGPAADGIAFNCNDLPDSRRNKENETNGNRTTLIKTDCKIAACLYKMMLGAKAPN